MALFVSNCENYKSEQVHVQDFHIRTQPALVTEVQADGQELERCLALLRMKAPRREDGKPVRVVTFYGDQAKFIVGNWE